MNKKPNRNLILVALFSVTILLSWAFSAIHPKTEPLIAAHRHDRPSPTAIAKVTPETPVVTETVGYAKIDGQTINGYFAYPETGGAELPAIITIHEWWGLNDNIKAMTERLAGEGYQVLAVDLYKGETTESPEIARQLTQKVQENLFDAKVNLTEAYRYLTNRQQAPKVGVIGWCFGGSWSLETALLFPQDLDATVIYYGGQVGETPTEKLATLEMPILGIFGAEDSSIPVDTVLELESTLKQLGKTVEFHIYENAGHAFANPSGQNYVPEAAEQAWAETTEFFERHLAS